LTLSIKPQVNQVVDLLRSRLKPQAYGYAGAIKKGQLSLEQRQLTLKTPALRLDRDLPFYTCDSASALITRELTALDIEAVVIELAIPIHPQEDCGSVVHKVCLAKGEHEALIIGLAQPLDQLLGFYPHTSFKQASWIFNHFTGQAYNPFLLAPHAEIEERPSWNLSGVDPLIKPLAAQVSNNGTLNLVELAVGMVQNTLLLATVARVLHFDPASHRTFSQWNTNIYFELPITDLSEIINELTASRPDLITSLGFLRATGLGNVEVRQPNDQLAKQGLAFLQSTWPSVVQFITKLPQAELQQLRS